MAKYCVKFKVEARYVVEVEANSLEEAKEKGECEFSDADFGEAKDIDGEIITIENEFENFLYENRDDDLDL